MVKKINQLDELLSIADDDLIPICTSAGITKYIKASTLKAYATAGISGGGSTPSTTIFLSHFNGANNSTTFTDVKAHSIVTSGSPVISTTQSKFGGSSLYIPNTNSYIKADNHADFNLSEFTIEAFVYLDNQFASNNYYAYMLAIEASNIGVAIGKNRNGINNKWFVTIGNLASSSSIETIANVSLNEWHYIAVTRKNGVNKFYLDAVYQGQDSNVLNFGTNPFITIGNSPYNYQNYFTYGVRGMVGYVDEVRLSNVEKTITSVPAGAFSDT